MTGLRIDVDSDFCTGCGACKAICPQECIKLNKNNEGFLVPYINNNLCLNCGKCLKVCSASCSKIEGNSDEKQFAVAAVTKDFKLWKKSTSGGAFSEICTAIKLLAKNQKVLYCGAVFNGLVVYHLCTNNYNEIFQFRKSKYIQSDMRDCFKYVETALKDGQYVLFSGTPCQVYGLRKSLKTKYNKLFCIDLICHGTGSPDVFKYCLENEEKKYGKKVIEYTFRYKSPVMGTFGKYTSCIVFEDYRKKTIRYDNYNRLFLNQVCLRKSCGENCKFRNIDRQGDITIADFNAKSIVLPKVNDFKNYSTILFNNEQGRRLFELIEKNMEIYDCKLENICKYNPLVCGTTKGNPNREQFFEEYRNGASVESLVRKYGLVNKLQFSILEHIPYKLKRFLYLISRSISNGKK